jgi:hypothetical protein
VTATDQPTLPIEVLWRPQPGPQTAGLLCPAREILLGGGRGSGKSDTLLARWVLHAQLYGADAVGAIFRREYRQLEELKRRCNQLFPRLGAVFNKTASIWTFPNGATLRFGHLWDERDADGYHGFSFSFIGIEEAGNWPTPGAINRIRATLRSPAGVPVEIIFTANPGGPGAGWLKARFVTPAPAGYSRIVDPDTGQERCFIPSTIEDNPILRENDPAYESRLKEVGSPALFKAWRYGDWDAQPSGYFDDVWVPRRQIVPTFKVPVGWRWRRSFDYGTAAPASLGLWCVSDGSPLPQLKDRSFPRGSLIRVTELYTVVRDRSGNAIPNQGQRIVNSELGAMIAHKCGNIDFEISVADPSIFTEHGQPSTYASLREGAKQVRGSIKFDEAFNGRIVGWQMMRDLLAESAKERPERPGLWVMDNCTEFLRTVPSLQSDRLRPDDIDTTQEDHCGDDCRYMCSAKLRRLVVGTRVEGRR